jgi:hypothetical protein
MLGFCAGRIASGICLQMLQVFSSRSDIQQIQDEVLVPVLAVLLYDGEGQRVMWKSVVLLM